MKKTLVLLLAALMLLPLLFSCGNSIGETATTPAAVMTTSAGNTDAKGYEKDDLPADLNLNTTVTTLMWSDCTKLEFYVEETSGDSIESAIYKRNSDVEKRLGVKLDYVEEPGHAGSKETNFVKKFEADYQSGDHLFDIVATYSLTVPKLALKGEVEDLLTTDYFNVNKPWWPKTLTDECTINDRLYFASGDISTNLLWMMIGTFYNRELYAAYASDPLYAKTPEEYVNSNEWTMDLLFRMNKDRFEEMDGNNSRSVGDKFGMFIYDVNVDAFQTAAGIVALEKTADGSIVLSDSYTGDRCSTLCDQVTDFLKNTGVYHSNNTDDRKIFFEQRATFIMDRCFIVAGKDNNAVGDGKIEFSFGVIPQPKYSADQERYATNVGHPFTLYAISSGSDQIPAASAVLECLASESYRTVTPEVFESTMKVRYADDQGAAKMYDLIRNNVVFDLGRLYMDTFDGKTANLFRECAVGTKTSGFHTEISAYMNRFAGALEKITNAYAD